MTTIQLTPAQHAILAYAIEHTGGKIEWFPDNIKGGARTKVLEGLFNKALITRDSKDWFVAAEGYDALGRARPTQGITSEVTNDKVAADASAADAYDRAVVCAKEGAAIRKAHEEARRNMRANSKQALVIEMLRRPEGATIAEIMAATNWLAHTIRGTLSGALKRRLGLVVVSEKPEHGDRVYRIQS